MAQTVTVSWVDNSDNETGFYVFRKDGGLGVPGAWVAVGTVGANVTSFVDVSVVPGATYGYRVVAVNAAGWSEGSETEVAVQPVATIPAAPSGVTAVVNAG